MTTYNCDITMSSVRSYVCFETLSETSQFQENILLLCTTIRLLLPTMHYNWRFIPCQEEGQKVTHLVIDDGPNENSQIEDTQISSQLSELKQSNLFMYIFLFTSEWDVETKSPCESMLQNTSHNKISSRVTLTKYILFEH
jgi:hypothetical protein